MALGIDLQKVIATVEEGAADDPLARLEAASAANDELAAVGDALLTHFVGVARGSGASWTEIGRALGVTKQGAQQRYRARMIGELIGQGSARTAVALPLLTRFTPRARRSIRASADEARRLNHDHVGTEHLLLGLLSEPDGLAVQVLDACGHPATEVRSAVEARVHPGTEPVSGRGPFAPAARRVLHRTMSEALRLGHNYIGTEHILLGLMNEDGTAAEALRGLRLTHDQLSEKVVGLLAAQGEPG